MQIRQRKLLTPARLRMLASYKNRRRCPGFYWTPQYLEWVDGFRDFLLGVAVRGNVAHDAAQVEPDKVEHVHRAHAPPEQVD